MAGTTQDLALGRTKGDQVDILDLARWQFAITTVYHFIFVPVTIGMAPLVAIMQTKWLKNGEEHWLKLSEFFGKLLIINFAIGIATGIVQEFQFGMGWSEYSRYVGDIFGAPLAFEALLAFFLESTFLGIWIFGRGRVTPKVHTAAIWLFAIGSDISALFILAANSFMQNPTGATFNAETGRAELSSMGGFLNVLFSATSMYTFLHTLAASILIAGAGIAAIALWWLVKTVKTHATEAEDLWKPAAHFGLVAMLIGSVLVIATGHFAGQHITEVQPTKMAAAMGINTTEEGTGAELGLIYTGGDLAKGEGNVITLPIPGLESFMATNDPNGVIQGAKDLQEQFASEFGATYANGDPINYIPNVGVTFYSFRIMMAVGFIALLLSVIGLLALKKPQSISPAFAKMFLWSTLLPFIASSAGWIMTEVGRQPWVVYPNFAGDTSVRQLTMDGVSLTVHPFEIWFSLIIFTLLYLVLGIIWFILMKRYTQEGINTKKTITTDVVELSDNTVLSFSY